MTTSVSKSPAKADSHKPTSSTTTSQARKGISAPWPESGGVRYVHLPQPGAGGSPSTSTCVPRLTPGDPSSGIQVSTPRLPCPMPDRADSPTPQNSPCPSCASVSPDKSSVAQHLRASALPLCNSASLHSPAQHRTEGKAPGTWESPGSV